MEYGTVVKIYFSGVDSMIFVGIDVAKNSHFASAVNSDGEVILQPFSFSNSAEGFNLLLSKLDLPSIEHYFIGLESTGHYSDNIVSFLFSKGFKIGIINPIQSDALRNSNIRKTKNDKIDTFLIIQCLMLGKYTLFKQSDFDILKLKTLCRFRFDITQSKTRLKTQLTSCIDLIFPELQSFFHGNLHSKSARATLTKFTSPASISKVRVNTLAKVLVSTSRGRYSYDDAVYLKKLAANSIGIDNPATCIQVKSLIKQLDLLDEQITSIDLEIKSIMDYLNSPILTIPGISYTLGSMIISEIGDISKFSNPTKLLAYAGLDPSVRQSGNFNASSTRISKRGSKHLRYAIHTAASIIIFNNDTFYEYYTTKRSKGKSYRNAIGHVSNKLVRVIFKILTENIPFNLS